MNDLDRKIAELKGYWTKNWPVVCENPEFPEQTRAECDWSTSDSKALELVDELREEGFTFVMRSAEVGTGWIASFYNPFESSNLQGGGYARPEAICRAYIAAVTWMKEKKG